MSERPYIPLSEPVLGGNAWRYVKECLDTTMVSSVGAFVDRFEREVAAYLGVRHAVATVNGTAALHVALQLADVRPDDEVLVSTLTFIAPVNAIRYVRAWPVFMDADPKYWQIDPEKIADFVEKQCRHEAGQLRNRVTGRRVRAILPVHILGQSVDVDPIVELARKHDLAVIEDATESLGSRYKGRAPGTMGLLGCLSFNGNKIITTGGGGMIVSNDSGLASKAKYLTTQAKDDPIEYVHNEIGYNYRLVNVLAALGCAQLEQLDGHVKAKRDIAARYETALAELPGISLPRQAPWAESTSWLYTLLVDSGHYGEDSRGLLRRLARENIQTRPLWQPIHLSNAHRGCQAYRCDVAERVYRDALSLPCSVGLIPEDQDRVISALRQRSH